MPTVPKVTRQVDLAPLPGARLTAVETPESQGAGIAEAQGQIGEALAGVGHKTAALGEQVLEKADETALINADTQLGSKSLALLYDPATGAMTKRGQDALGAPERVQNDFDTFADTVQAGLPTARARAAFARIRAQRTLSLLATVTEHTASQVEQVKVGEKQANIDNSRALATTSPNLKSETYMRQLQQSLDQQAAMVASIGKDLGLGPEKIREQQAAAASATHVGVVDGLLSQGNSKDASAYFSQAKDQIDVVERLRLSKAVAQGDARADALPQADAIIAAGGSLKEQLAKAKAITDANPGDEHAATVREIVEQRIEHRDSIDKKEKLAAAEDLGDSGIKSLIRFNGDYHKAITPTMEGLASGEQLKAWKAYAEKLSKGEPIETNVATYDVLERLATSRDPDERQKFAAMNLLPYSALLSKEHMTHFLDVQGAIRKSDPEKVTALTATESLQRQIVDGNLVGLGINPNPPAPGKDGYDKQASDRVLAYRRAVRDAVAAREAHTKKKVTEPEMQDIADSLMAQTAAEKTHWFAANEPARYAFETPDTGVTRAADVPASERTQIEAALKKAGLPISETAIVNLFNQHLQAVRGKPR